MGPEEASFSGNLVISKQDMIKIGQSGREEMS